MTDENPSQIVNEQTEKKEMVAAFSSLFLLDSEFLYDKESAALKCYL